MALAGNRVPPTSILVTIALLLLAWRFGVYTGLVQCVEAGADGSGAHVIVARGVSAPFAVLTTRLMAKPAPGDLVLVRGDEHHIQNAGVMLVARHMTIVPLTSIFAVTQSWPNGIYAFFSARRATALVLGLILLAFNRRAAGILGELLLGILLTAGLVALLSWLQGRGYLGSPAPVIRVLVVLSVATAFAFAHHYAGVGAALLSRVALALLTIPLSQPLVTEFAPFSLVVHLAAVAVPLLIPTAPIWILGAWLFTIGLGFV